MKPVLVALLFCGLGLAQIFPISPAQMSQAGALAGQSIVLGVSSWGPSVAGVLCTITAQTSVICIHNLGSANVRPWVWDSSGYLVRPALKQNISINATTITFDGAFTGIVVIK